MMTSTRLFLACLVLAITTARGLAQNASAEQIRFFETSIRPLLAEHCWKCHDVKKQRGDLRLDTRDFLLKGGSSGPVVNVAEPEKSLILRAVRHEDESLKMPPSKKLRDAEVASLMRWIRMGVPYPPDLSGVRKEDPKSFWAFQPMAAGPVPAVKNSAWPTSDLDRFILARLEQKNLQPAAPADRRTWIRRVTFDVTGLPPMPDEVDAFLADTSADAFAKVVDRLLASPHYAERWARHWLDVVRYADSNGLDENVAFGNAWRYRDYVVGALDRDKPYDQFLVEQLAGDLLPSSDDATRNERLIATGFLGLGPKVLAEVDATKMELDVIDEQIDTFGRSFLGLTLGCARCHDHKFDPLTMQDYYGLAGIFKSTRTMEHFKKVARWYENPLGTGKQIEARAEFDRLVTRKKGEIQQIVQKASERVKAATAKDVALPKNLESMFPAEVKADLKRLRDELAVLEKSAPELPTALGATEGTVVNASLYLRGNHLKPGAEVARQVPRILAGETPPTFSSQQSGRLELARWLTDPRNPLTARVMVNRVWRWHFGQGLVRSTDNFGRLGEKPDNLPLLDWLSTRFIEKGWSLKALHREILLSSTYRMSAVPGKEAAAADPENRLLAHANVRRLEAEEVRDALLEVGGCLDRTRGGPVLHVKNRQYLFDHTSRDLTKYDSRRRSLYLPVVRNNVYDVFGLFDFPDPAVPNGDRSTTTVAPQALFLLNSDWVADVCQDLAADLIRKDADGAGRVQRLYRRAYARRATESEVSKALALVQSVDGRLTTAVVEPDRRQTLAWACLCQTVVSANEFIFLD